MAIDKGVPDIVDLLIEGGMNVEETSYFASSPGGLRVSTPLLAAAAKNDFWGVARMLKPYRGMVDTRDKNGRTLLFLAAEHGHEAGLHELLKLGADVNAKDKAGMRPLHIAAKKGHSRIVLGLLKYRVNFKVIDNAGRSPLHYAAAAGSKHLVKMTLAKGNDKNGRDKQGKTPLALAMAGGHKAVVDFLKSRKAQQ